MHAVEGGPLHGVYVSLQQPPASPTVRYALLRSTVSGVRPLQVGSRHRMLQPTQPAAHPASDADSPVSSLGHCARATGTFPHRSGPISASAEGSRCTPSRVGSSTHPWGTSHLIYALCAGCGANYRDRSSTRPERTRLGRRLSSGTLDAGTATWPRLRHRFPVTGVLCVERGRSRLSPCRFRPVLPREPPPPWNAGDCALRRCAAAWAKHNRCSRSDTWHTLRFRSLNPGHAFEIAMTLVKPAAASQGSAFLPHGSREQAPRRTLGATRQDTSVSRRRGGHKQKGCRCLLCRGFGLPVCPSQAGILLWNREGADRRCPPTANARCLERGSRT